uniref:Uncharacterized protein n=1 Tax=Arundo donax TaxID=35708 RepID=A0A0A9DST1_ARUDO
MRVEAGSALLLFFLQADLSQAPDNLKTHYLFSSIIHQIGHDMTSLYSYMFYR